MCLIRLSTSHVAASSPPNHNRGDNEKEGTGSHIRGAERRPKKERRRACECHHAEDEPNANNDDKLAGFFDSLTVRVTFCKQALKGTSGGV